MRSPTRSLGPLLIALSLGACAGGAPTVAPSTAVPSTQPPGTAPAATASDATATPAAPVEPSPRSLLFDTDVAADDLVALAFVLSAPQVDLVGITVSGTGEAHCAGGVDVVLRLLDRLGAPDIPVACGRDTPLAGSHAFPDAWREHVDTGSGLVLDSTDREASTATAVELITQLSTERAELHVLATGPLTNLGDALLADPGLATRLGPIFVMGGALHVPGNLVCCGAPEGNSVAEWNIYVDPRAARVVVDTGLEPSFVSLDGTNQVPVTREFAALAIAAASSPAGRVLADLFAANPFMTDGSYYLWDPLAAQLASGYPIGSFTAARIVVEEAEGIESGFTRPVDGVPNIQYLTTVDPGAAGDTLLGVLNGG